MSKPVQAYPVAEANAANAVDPNAWGYAPAAATAAQNKGGVKHQGGDSGSSTLVLSYRLYLALALGVAGLACCFTWPTKLRVAVIHPSARPLLEDAAYLLAFVCACTGAIGAIDLLVAGRFKGRYFALHTIVNVLVIALSVLDTLEFFGMDNPLKSVTCLGGRSQCGSKGPIALTASLHFWHMFAYDLKPIDWVHHLPALTFTFVGLYFPFGPILNYSLLCAFMGVPGCIDYALLTLVKQGKVAPRVEKDLNQSLNVWLRCPCAVIAGYLQLVDPLVHGDQYLHLVHRLVVLLSGVHSVWNGCFFMYRTVDARTRFVLANEAPRGAGAAAKTAATALM